MAAKGHNMNPIELQGLLSIPNNQGAADRAQGAAIANAMQIPGGVAALNAPALSRGFQNNIGAMFGMDMRTPAQKAQEALKGIAINTPEGQKQAIEIIGKIDPARATALSAYFDQANMTQAEKQKAAEQEMAKSQAVAAQTQTMVKMALEAKQPGLAELAKNGGFAGDTKGFMDALEKKSGGVGGMASAKSEILFDGSTIMVLPDGSTVVKNAAGEIVPPEQRAGVIKNAMDVKLAYESRGEQEQRSIDRAEKMVDRVQLIRESLTTYDDAIAQLDAGASTGVLQSLLPSFRAATIRLENTQKQMGLDVVGAATFGALSKGELDLALSKALPTSLKPDDLRVWIEDKKAAQVKLMEYMENAALFFSGGGTSAEWIKAQREAEKQPQSSRIEVDY